MSDLVGKTVGDFQVLSKIGEGSMGIVYIAYDQSLERQVALKAMLPEVVKKDAEYYHTRFDNEVKFTAQLQHPNIVHIYNYWESEDSKFYTMQLLTGGTLEGMLKRNELPDFNSLMRIARSIADALDFVHSKGILHRNISPSNILLDAFGSPYLVDFGVAARVGHKTDVNNEILKDDSHYYSPERLQGANETTTTEIFDFTAMMFHVLTGRYPYPGETIVQKLRHIMKGVPLKASEIRPDLPTTVDQVFEKGLSIKPDERYRTASDFVEALADALRYGPRRNIFVSYSSKDRAKIYQLVDVLEGLGHRVWYDQRLQATGGQDWWTNILQHLRKSTLFIFALSSYSLDSEPCRLEYTYADKLDKIILPVVIEEISYHRMPAPLARIQSVDFTDPFNHTVLRNSIDSLPHGNPLPYPLPPEPPAPISEISYLAEMLQGDTLSTDEQLFIIAKLEKYCFDTQEEEVAKDLLRQMLQKPELTDYSLDKIKRLL